MTIDTLVQTLRDQATNNNSVSLNTDVLASDQVALISTAFMLGAGQPLTVNGISAADIPDATGNSVQISKGSASLLTLSNITPTITLTVDGDGNVQSLISVNPGASWVFTDSFPGLTVFPFNKLSLADTYFIYSSLAQQNYSPWTDKAQETISLVPGLNFTSWMTLDIFAGAIALLEDVLNVTTQYKFYGPFSPNPANPYPVTTLALELTGATFDITSTLTIGGLSLIIQITEPEDSIQLIEIGLAASFGNLVFSVAISEADPALTFSAAPAPGTTVTAADILTLPGGSDFQTFIPDELATAFQDVGLNDFQITLGDGKAVSSVGFSIGSVPGFTLTLIPDVMVLEDFALELSYFDPFGASLAMVSFSANCKLLPSMFPDPFAFDLELDNAGGKWEISNISGAYNGSVTLSNLVQGIVGNTTNLPSELNDIVFSDFGADASKLGDGYTYTLYGNCSASFPILSTELISSLYIKADYSASGYDMDLKGAMGVGEQNFALELKLSETSAPANASSSIVLSASWSVSGTDYLEFEDIAAAFGFSGSDIPPIPSGLDLSLKSAALHYEFSPEKQLAIGFQSVSYGNAVFASLQLNSKAAYYFGLVVPHTINLSNLPLINSVLPSDETVQIKNIQAIISSASIQGNDITTVNNLVNALGDGYPNVPDAGMSSGVALSMIFSAGSWDTTLSIATGNGGGTNQLAGGGGAPSSMALATTGSTPPPTQSSDGTTWFNLQKTFGPVTFQKVGIKYQDSVLYLLMNASLSAGGLTIQLMGLGAGSPLTTFDLHFTIDGIAITFQEGPVEISGGLVGTLDPINFYGEIVLGMPEFQISALGGYAEISGQPSFFLYAVLDYPFGGPEFFFVTGLAAGFGYNRSLVIPDVSGVATFPLVQWATGSGNPPAQNPSGDVGQQVLQVLNTLETSGVVAPSIGTYWLAVGIMFTSFELVNSFALLTVTFGTKFEIDVLGLSTLSIPPDDPAPVAQVQIELKASFAPADGVLSIAGQLTPQSYVLSQACHLTGGFAFYLWFSGPHQGETILTVGGYNPNFTVPDYYPQVPRLGMNWQVSDALSITGELYFAICSNAAMAGGKMSAVWNSGPISAWFTVWADFLMIFKPFHYYISAGIDLGASFSIKLLFVRINITIHVGVSLEIWGPDFAGRATVDLDIISFTVHFGDSDQNNDTTIAWSDFVTNMLPSSSQSSQNSLQMKPAAFAVGSQADDSSPSQPATIQIIVTQGMIKVLDNSTTLPWYLVSGETFLCSVITAIPNKEEFCTWVGHAQLAPDSQQPVDDQGTVITPTAAFGAGPAGIQPGDFKPGLTIEVDTEEESEFVGVRLLNNSAKALWENKSFDSNGVPQADPGTALTQTTIPNTLQGYQLVPTVPPPDHTLPIPLPTLEFTLDDVVSFTFNDPTYPTTDSFSNQTVAGTITNAAVVGVRSQLLTAMQQQGVTINTSINVTSLNNTANNDLLAAPQLDLLGEQKDAS